MDIAFGPVPSRRLGMSLGVNNIPDKVCTYACVYCQIGRTLKMEVEPREFYPPEFVVKSVVEKLEAIKKAPDYITFVPDGEPTLDINLEKEIEGLRNNVSNIRIAVITNSSLLWREDVRVRIINADYVSLKVDSCSEHLWKKIDRPHKSLKLEKILEGIRGFTREFSGTLVTETMLIGGVDYSEEFEKLGKFLSEINPDITYIAVPTRPPWESWVRQPSPENIARAYDLLTSYGLKVEYLIGYEGNQFVNSGNIEEDILAITSVHPMRRDAVEKMLKNTNASWKLIEKLLTEKKLIMVTYGGQQFFIRNMKSWKK